ncbi:MAG: hypothetical protein JF595_12875 [Sphingomonadales bacterium]|nr:hypothetical protein [Sphingomonadales bacterium]
MNRILLGALAALLLTAAGVFWWQGRAATERGAPPPPVAALASGLPADELPTADGRGLQGAAPPEADEVTREQRRFDRLDRNRDGIITRNELLAFRAAAFRALDTDHNNLLSFEEWAVRTSNRFKAADRDGDQRLTRAEFATTKPKRAAQPQCRCAPARAGRVRASARQQPPPPAEQSADDGGDPEM